MKISYSSLCDKGLKRKTNQDAIFAYAEEEFGVFVVADGMGGLSEGERASKEIVNAFQNWVENTKEAIPTMDPGAILQDMRVKLSAVNDSINAATQIGQKCGSTVVILFIRSDFYGIISAGDSRIYEIEDRFLYAKLKQITIDDALMFEGENTGKLTNAIGINSRLKCHAQSDVLKGTKIFILCSDGVYRYCDEKTLVRNIIKYSSDSLSNAVHEIRDTIYENGAGDNLSMILVHCINK